MSINLKSRIQSLIKTRRINVFLLFLILAFGILLLTKLSKVYTIPFDFNLNKINIPEEEVILSNTDQQIQVTMKTNGFELLKYYLAKPDLIIDFSEQIDKSDKAYIWTKNKGFLGLSSQFSKNIEILNIVPDSLFFFYDVSGVKMVPVEVLIDINYSPGYNSSDKMTCKPDSIKVIGAEVLLAKLNKIQTDTLKLDDVKQDVSENIELQLPEEFNDLKFLQKKVEVSGKVEKHTEGMLKIPVEIINIPEKVKLKHFPKAVNVSYYTSLVNFNTIDEKQFKVICDYNKMVDGQSFLKPEIIAKPSSIKYAKIKDEQIDFIITE